MDDALMIALVIMLFISMAYCIGYRNGLHRGYNAGLEDGKYFPTKLPPIPEVMKPIEVNMQRVQCVYDMKLYEDWDSVTITRFSTEVVYGLCNKLVNQLLAENIVRPVILAEDQEQNTRRIGFAIYVARDPTLDENSNVVFLRREFGIL